jgi:hypothetical protein
MERTINSLGKVNQRKLRQFKNVRSITQLKRLYPQARTNDEALYLAQLEYNLGVITRNENIKRNITNIRSSLSREISKISRNGNYVSRINLVPVHNFYTLKGFVNDLIQRIDRYLPNRKLLLTIHNIKYALGITNRQTLLDSIEHAQMFGVGSMEGEGSDAGFVSEFTLATSMTIELLENNITENNNWFQRAAPTGGFFPYYNKTKYDFSQYGIYRNEEEYKTKNENICLINALKHGGLSIDKIEQLKLMVKNSHIPVAQLEKICEKLEIQIQLKREKKEKTTIYGKEYDETYKIGLLLNHYFILNTSNNTSYSVGKYDEVKDIKYSHSISEKNGKYFKRDQKLYINSFSLVSLLIENSETLLTKIPYQHLTRTQYYKKTEEVIETLEYNEDTLEPIEYEEKEYDSVYNVFFDFETRTLEDKQHVPYLCCFITDDGKRGSFIGDDSGLQLLKYLSSFKVKHIQMIAHNATYDYQFLVKHLSRFSEISRGNRLISASGFFGKMKVSIKCSLHLIASSLKSFGEMFKLSQKKEVMPYDLYNIEEQFNKRFCSIDFVLNQINEHGKSFLKDSEKPDFLRNIDDWKLKGENNTFDIIEYSRRYCELDCIVLRDGYNIFRKWILSLELPDGQPANLDINNILTCAGLAHTYLLKSGCYDGLYELNGVPQRFIQKTVVGGRTMCANNKKTYVNNGRKVSDFDGVSLYPSAMFRMPGYLKGKPKVLQTTDYNTISQYDGYFVEVKILNIPVKRAFPLCSEKNKDGVRVFSNKIDSNVFMDKIQMEDLIHFHGLNNDDFQIIRGYYFNEGFNSNITETIKYLFNTRLQKKREKNPSETIYKLIMNSAYGKSIMKEILNETRIFENAHDYGVYVSRNYDYVESIQKIDGCDKYKVKSTKTVNEHVNIAQVGSSVLSWSKRIMNEVMCLAEDLNINIFYQDTDSMHMYEDQIEILGNEFRRKYNRELIGESLGQFHTDFDIKYQDDGKTMKCKNVYSKRLITLGKKSYCDELVGTDHNGNEHVDYHVRMKGIPNSCIDYTVQQLGLKTPFELYERLYKGHKVKFDLTEGKHKAVFRYNGNYSVKTEVKFEREVKF